MHKTIAYKFLEQENVFVKMKNLFGAYILSVPVIYRQYRDQHKVLHAQHLIYEIGNIFYVETVD